MRVRLRSLYSAQRAHHQPKYSPGGAVPRLLPGLVLVLSLAAGCTGMHPTRDTTPKADPAALTVVAEIALERGDCKEAAESYAKAAKVGAVSLARRASLVALAASICRRPGSP